MFRNKNLAATGALLLLATSATAGATISRTELQGAAQASSQPAPADGGYVSTPSAGLSTNQFVVSTATELRSALEAARTLNGGAEIRVRPGNYGALKWNNKAYTKGRVYMIAATTTRPVFTSMSLTGSSGMAVVGMQISGTERAVVYLNTTKDMIFAGNLVTGANRNKDPWDDNNTGVHVRFADRITLSHNIFEDLRGSTYVQRSSKVVFEYNTMRNVREGLNVAAVNNLDITRNYFHSFSPNIPAGEHPDSIQFWTSGETAGSTSVNLIENVMVHGGCAAIQGIFIRSETEGKPIPQVRHRNFVIRGNVYYGASKHGTTVSSVDGALVENNVVIASPYSETGVSRPEAQAKSPRCSGALQPAILSTNGNTTHVFRKNITTQMGSTSGSVADTIIVGRAGGEPYTNVFPARPTGETPSLSAFVTKNPSAARTRRIGVLASFAHGASLTTDSALARARSVHKS